MCKHLTVNKVHKYSSVQMKNKLFKNFDLTRNEISRKQSSGESIIYFVFWLIYHTFLWKNFRKFQTYYRHFMMIVQPKTTVVKV